MPTKFFSGRVTQHAYFDQILAQPSWEDLKILDFGGNTGGFLQGAGERVEHRNYWCMDINKQVIEKGQQTYPNANFVHYDLYSSEYNPQGIYHLPIPTQDAPFDLIVAFSVFTHIHQIELVALVNQLRAMLSPDGVLAFTFTDASYDRRINDPSLTHDTGVRHQLHTNREFYPHLTDEKINAKAIEAAQSPWCILIEDQLHLAPGEHLSNQNRQGVPNESYCVYYSVEHMASLFPEAKILSPVAPQWQYCCVLGRG
ncbi:MAG: SAM-dependent methyltransferase [Phenylobacterium sp.]|jgi:SAM-dependent methyltransferase